MLYIILILVLVVAVGSMYFIFQGLKDESGGQSESKTAEINPFLAPSNVSTEEYKPKPILKIVFVFLLFAYAAWQVFSFFGQEEGYLIVTRFQFEHEKLDWSDISNKLIKNDWASAWVTPNAVYILENSSYDRKRFLQVFGKDTPKVLDIIKHGEYITRHGQKLSGLIWALVAFWIGLRLLRSKGKKGLLSFP